MRKSTANMIRRIPVDEKIKLSCQYKGLVTRIAERYAWRCTTLSIEDLIQEGNIGLWHALNRYRPEKGGFLKYAAGWIRHYITRSINDTEYTIRIPARAFKRGASVSCGPRNFKDGTDIVNILDIGWTDPSKALAKAETTRRILRLIMEKFDSRDRLIIQSRIGLGSKPCTFQQIGKKVRLTVPGVKYRFDRAVRILTRALAH